MRPVPLSVKAPRLPQVNLIPPEIGLRRARARQRTGILIILVMFFAVVAGVGYWVHLIKADKEQELVVAEERYAELQREAQQYSSVPVVRDAVTNAENALIYVGATEIYYVDFLEMLADSLPSTMEPEEVLFNRTTLTSNAAPGANPFSRPDLGEVLFTVYSEREVDAAAMIERFETLLGLEHVRLTVTIRELDDRDPDNDDPDIVYVIEGSGRLTVEALTNRFAPEGWREQAPPVVEEPAEEGGDQ